MNPFLERCQQVAAKEAVLREGGGPDGLARQHKLGRLFARKRIAALIDDPNAFLETGLWAAHSMYQDWGKFPAAGVVTGIAPISGHPCMIVANDATVKAGAFVPMTCKKVLRAQRIAFECNLPLVYLVDSAGVFLPMQDEIFPDEDDFGRIFRNNAVISAAGIPQYAAIMGNCVAGGAYLPVLCDKVLMTEGSGLYLAGPQLVKAAIGQETDTETLGGAAMRCTPRFPARLISKKRMTRRRSSGYARSSDSCRPKLQERLYGAMNHSRRRTNRGLKPLLQLLIPNSPRRKSTSWSAWTAGRKYAVMGAAQASDVVFSILTRSARDKTPAELDALRAKVKADYTEQTDIRYGAARGWVDAIIQPHDTRATLLRAFALACRPPAKASFHTGVLQV